MHPYSFILVDHYVGLAVLLIALEECGRPVRYSSFADLANQCTDLVGWPVDRRSLHRKYVQVQRLLRENGPSAWRYRDSVQNMVEHLRFVTVW